MFTDRELDIILLEVREENDTLYQQLMVDKLGKRLSDASIRSTEVGLERSEDNTPEDSGNE